MDHSSLYKTNFTIKSGRRLNESKVVRQQKRNECFQQGRFIAVSPTPKKIKQDHSKYGNENEKIEENDNKSTIPLDSNVENGNLRNCNNNNIKSDEKLTDIQLKVPEKKRTSIKSKMLRQEIFLNRYCEYKKNKEMKKMEQNKSAKPKPFVAACFKNSVLGEYNNVFRPIETKSKNTNTQFNFQMKNFVLLPPAQTSLPNKKNMISESIHKKKLPVNDSKTKTSNTINRKPLGAFNENVQKNFKPNEVKKLERKSTKLVTKKSGYQSPFISKDMKNPVNKNEINKVPVNTKKIVQNDKSGFIKANTLFKKPLESNNDQTKKSTTLKRPPIFFKPKKVTKITQKPEEAISSHNPNEKETNHILETTNVGLTKSTTLNYVTSTLRKYPGDSLPSPLDLEESVIKPITSIKNTSLENDLKPIASSSDENSPMIQNTESKSTDFNLNKPKSNDATISEKDNDKMTPRRISERLSTKKKRTCCSGDYLIDIWKRTPVQSSVSHHTPPQSSVKENQNYYMSPQVVVSRGKVSARKERERRNSIYLIDVTSPQNSLVRRTKETISYFRAQLNEEEVRLLKLCSDWLDYLKTLSSDVISDVAGPMVNAAIGVTNLLISKKMKKFESLIQRCEETLTTDKFDNVNIEDLDDSFKPVQIQDLDGFWCIIRQQIDDLEKRFNNLIRWRDNDWKDPDFLLPDKKKERTRNNVIKKKKVKKSETSGNPKLKEAIQRMRNERLKEIQAKNCDLNVLNDIVEIIPNQRNARKSVKKVEVIEKVSAEKDTSKRRNSRISQIISPARRKSTPRSSRNSVKKGNLNISTNYFEESSLISFAKTPDHNFRKSILKTPGTARKNCSVLFHERIAEYKSPEYISPEGRVSLGRTRGGTKRKRVSTRELLFTND